MKIALAVEGTRGDVYPMLALAAHLEAAGHAPVLVAPPEFAAVAAERGVAFRAAGNDVRSYLTEHAQVLSNSGPRALRAQLRFIGESIERQFATVPEATAGADLIIGAGVQLVGPSAAELHGVPYRYLMYCPAMLPSLEHAPALIALAGLPRWGNRLAWWSMRRMAFPLIRRALDPQRARLGLPALGDPLEHLFSQRPLMAADAAIAPVPEDAAMKPVQIAYLQDVDSPPLPEKLEDFLAAGPPPVYFGFGSMTDARPDETTRALIAAARAAGLRALISQGWAGLGEGALPSEVMSVGTVSHARLFPRVCAVVHHGGAGTTTAAARAGVPQIVVPHFVDQFYWQERVRLLGLGPKAMKRRHLNAETLAAALHACRDNDILLERTRAIGFEIRTSLVPQADVRRVAEG